MRAALVLAALSALAGMARGAAVMMTKTISGDQLGGGVAVELPGAPLWRLDRAFQRTCVAISCTDGKKYETFEGSDHDDVLARFNQTTLSGQGDGMEFCISPFGATYLALRQNKAKPAAAPPGQSCTVVVSAHFSNHLAALAFAGAMLFASARALSHSALFRVSSGGAAVSALAVIALLLYVTRPLWRHSSRMLLACFGVSLSGLYKLWARSFGLQSWHAIATSPHMLGYVGVTFTIGALATYVMDTPGGPHRERITNAFEALLRAVGLIAICIGVQDWRVGGATAAALCGTELLHRMLVALQPLLRWARERRAARHGVHAGATSAEENEAMRAGRTPRGAATTGGEDHTPSTDSDCELVRKGLAYNPSTDRPIKIGGDVYNRMVATGSYVLNRSTGMMQRRGAASAPPGARRGTEATTPGSAVAPRRLERALAEDSPAELPPAGSAGRSEAAALHFASRSPSPQGRKPRAGASPKPAARRKSGRT